VLGGGGAVNPVLKLMLLPFTAASLVYIKFNSYFILTHGDGLYVYKISALFVFKLIGKLKISGVKFKI
jgi:hypothetical protein